MPLFHKTTVHDANNLMGLKFKQPQANAGTHIHLLFFKPQFSLDRSKMITKKSLVQKLKRKMNDAKKMYFTEILYGELKKTSIKFYFQ